MLWVAVSDSCVPFFLFNVISAVLPPRSAEIFPPRAPFHDLGAHGRSFRLELPLLGRSSPLRSPPLLSPPLRRFLFPALRVHIPRLNYV